VVRRFELLFVVLISAYAVADCVAPAAPQPPATTADYQARVAAFVKSGCFLTDPGWGHDVAPRLTGATANGATYTVHDQFQVYYSPAMLKWMADNRQAAAAPNGASIPDGSAMVALVYPLGAKPPAGKSGYLVMIRQSAGRPTDPASGWFFSQVVTSTNTYGGTRVASSTGDFSLTLCVACHASAVNNFTFANYLNVKQAPAASPYTPAFLTQSTSDLLSALTPPTTPQLRQPLKDPAAQGFIDFFNEAVAEFRKKPLPAVTRLPMSKVLAIPNQDTDDVYRKPHQKAFLTSNQCQGCHDTTALLATTGASGLRQWTPANTAYKYSQQGPGGPPKGGDKFDISQYGEWSVSIMALASRDPAFLSQVETERVLHAAVEPTSVDNFCYRCHGPMGQRQFHIDHGGDPTQSPPDKPHPMEPNFSHIMTYSTPGGCMYQGFPCNQPGSQPAFSKYGALARDGISCTMCHHIGPQDGPPPANPWEVFYGFLNPAVAQLESPPGFPFPFAGSVLYDLDQFVAPPQDPLQSYVGSAHWTPGKPQQAQIFGHQQNFGIDTGTADYLPKGEFCGGCHVVIAPEIPQEYPRIRNKYQIGPNGQIYPAHYPQPGNTTPCPPVKALPNGQYDPTIDPCVAQSYEQTTYLEWAASASFGGNTPQTSCTYCHMPNAEGGKLSIANIDTPGNTDGKGGFPKPAYRADDQTTISSNGSYPRHRLMAINLFVHEMFQQFTNILGISPDTEAAVAPGTVKNLQNAEETILTHAPVTLALSVCKPGQADTTCSNLQNTPGSLTYQVTVQNYGGHRFPTGAGFRRGFIELRLLDANGKTLWVSGAVNRYGAMVDNNGKVLATEFPPGDVKYQPEFLQPHFGSVAHPAITRQDQAQIYEVRATNEYGQLTTATTRLFGGAKDNRIPPAGWVPPYDCSGKKTPNTAQSGHMVNGLDSFLLSRITAPEGIDDSNPNQVTISPDGAFSDPSYCTPGGVLEGQPTGISGTDRVLYQIPLSDLKGSAVAMVIATMHYQTIPPYFLRDRYYDGQTYSHPATEGGVVGLGAATERFLYASSHLDTTISNSIPQQQNLPNPVSTNWTMDIGSACMAEGAATCPPPSQNPLDSPERSKLKGVFSRTAGAYK